MAAKPCPDDIATHYQRLLHTGRLTDSEAQAFDRQYTDWREPRDQTTKRHKVKLAALDRYHDEHGNIKVPVGYVVDGFNLRAWIGSCRMSKKAGALPDWLVHELDSRPYWVWDAHEAGHRETLEHLDRYYREHGNGLVPSSYVVDGFNLGQRVRDYRAQHRKGLLPQWVVDELNSRPYWVWDAHEAGYREALAYLDRYYLEHGNGLVPKRYVVDGFKLGHRVNFYRAQHRKGLLPQWLVDELNSRPYWVWSVR